MREAISVSQPCSKNIEHNNEINENTFTVKKTAIEKIQRDLPEAVMKAFIKPGLFVVMKKSNRKKHI